MFVNSCNTNSQTPQNLSVKCANTITFALGAIAILGGTLALLATSGVNLGAFNALGSLTHAGGSVLVVSGLLMLTLGLHSLCKRPARSTAVSFTPGGDTAPPVGPTLSGDMDAAPATSESASAPPPATVQAVSVPPFAPLEALKQERAQRFATSPTRAVPPFSELEAIQAKTQPLTFGAMEYTHTHVRNHAQVKLQEHCDTLIQAATHPDHLRQIEVFLQETLAQYNLQLKARNLEPLTIELDLSAAIQAWSALEQMACQPILTQEVVSQLAYILLPQVVQTQLRAIVGDILTKPTLRPFPADVLTGLQEELQTSFSPPPLFADQLQAEICALFAPNPDVNLRGEHFAQIRSYVLSELRKYAIDLRSCPLAADLVRLEESWNSLHVVLTADAPIDCKIESLGCTARNLPDQNFWNRYPSVKNQLGVALTTHLATAYFSHYQFRLPLDEADQMRKVSIEGAYWLIAQKLGCEAPELVIEPDTTNDAVLAATLA